MQIQVKYYKLDLVATDSAIIFFTVTQDRTLFYDFGGSPTSVE